MHFLQRELHIPSSNTTHIPESTEHHIPRCPTAQIISQKHAAPPIPVVNNFWTRSAPQPGIRALHAKHYSAPLFLYPSHQRMKASAARKGTNSLINLRMLLTIQPKLDLPKESNTSNTFTLSIQPSTISSPWKQSKKITLTARFHSNFRSQSLPQFCNTIIHFSPLSILYPTSHCSNN